nr:Ig-like domain-containing protein [Gimesia maris]
MLTVAPVSDEIASAYDLDLVAEESTQFHAEIGDEATMDLDVDIYQVQLLDGQELIVDVDALLLDDGINSLSSLDSLIRIFSSDGTELASNDNGIDPDTALSGNDAILSFIAPAHGTYFIGISGAANLSYDPEISYSGSMAEVGEYYLQVSVGTAPAAPALKVENIQSASTGTITGYVANDSGVYMPSVDFDFDGDGTVDDTAYPDGQNFFSQAIDPGLIGDGLTVYVRASDYDFMTSSSLQSPWYAVHVTYEAPVNEAPVISNLTLVNDTDTPGDLITTDARVSGVLIDDVSNYEYTIEFDFNNDGYADDSQLAGNGSSFTIDAGSYLTPGEVTVNVRGLEWDEYLQTTIAGDWYSISFTYETDTASSPQITSLQLTNDTDIPGDHITTDSALHGQVTYVGDLAAVILEVDLNGDQITDEFAYIDSMTGDFSYTPGALSPGSHTVYIRAFDEMTLVAGEWSSISFTLEDEMMGGGTPEITSLQLFNDTDMPGDNITTDPTLSGQVTYMGDLYSVMLEVDLNGDQIMDDYAYIDGMTGQFSYTPGSLSPGSHTISIRAFDEMAMVSGQWSSISFTLEDEMMGGGAPEITSLQLFNDTDMPGDNITTDPALSGQVSYMGDLYSVMLEVDLNGDQIMDEYAYIDGMTGQFSYTPGSLSPGSYTISIRAFDEMAMVSGQWSSISFTLEDEMMGGGAPEITSLQLFNDTDMPGDNITTDPALSGQVSYMGDLYSVMLEVDLNGDQVMDDYAYIDGMTGEFTYTPESLTPGTYTISIRAFDEMAMVTGQWSSISFTLEDEMMGGGEPEITSLQLSNDTDMPGDNITTDPALSGQVLYMGDLYSVMLEVDLNGDQIMDEYAYIDGMTGQFSYTPGSLSPGSHTISIRAFDEMTMVSGQWSSISFTLEDEMMGGGAPEITSLQLFNDTDMPGDGFTTDPTIMGYVSYPAGIEYVSVDIDINGDGTIETSVTPDFEGYFSFDPSAYVSLGPVLISVRAVDQMMGISGQWSNLSFDLEEGSGGETGTSPEITSLSLWNDTDVPGDGYTTDPTLTGQITYLGDMIEVAVEIDVDGDGFVDATAWPDMGGYFTYNPLSLITLGSNTIYVRAQDTMTMNYGEWSSISFTLEEEMSGMTPEITSMQLSNDTDMPGDNITTDPALSGQVTYMGDLYSVMLEIDLNGDQVMDDYAYIDGMTGEFTYTPESLSPGYYTISIRAYDEMSMNYGEWSSISFTLEEEMSGMTPEITSLQLSNDTDMPGDNITTDPALSGQVSYMGDLYSVMLEIDLNGDQVMDDYAYIDGMTGEFTYTPESLSPGYYTISIRAYDEMSMNYGEWTSLSFELQNEPTLVPIAGTDAFLIEQESPTQSLAVLGNDTDPFGMGLSITAVSSPASGTVSIQAGTPDTLLYTPAIGFTGTETFTYTITDGNGETSTASVTVTVHEHDDTVATARATALVLDNVVTYAGTISDGPETDLDVDLFAISLNVGEMILADLDAAYLDGGTVLSNLNGLLRLFDANGNELALNDDASDPDTGVASTDALLRFTAPVAGMYYLGISAASNDGYDATTAGSGTSASGGRYQLQLTLGQNHYPVATDDSYTLEENSTISIDLLANDLDSDNHTVTLVGVTQPTNGTVVWSIDGQTSELTVEYTPDADFTGTDSFTYTITDIYGAESTATVTLTVEPPAPNEPPQITDLDLVLDTGALGDLITSYGHLSGTVSDTDQSSATYEIQVDFDNDGVEDFSVSASEFFELDLTEYLDDGEVTLQVRAGEWDTQTEADLYGEWSSFTFTYDAPLSAGTPFVSGFSLVNDTDTPGDLITSDATVGGLIVDDGTNSDYLLQFDLDNDGFADYTEQWGATPAFSLDLWDQLESGDHTIQVRAIGLSSEGYGYIYGVWSALTFTYEAPLVLDATIDSLELVTDSGTDSDQITINPAFQGEVSAGIDYSNLTVELDFQNDGIVDSTTSVDSNGAFTVDPSAEISIGENTIAVRLVDQTTGAIGDWSTLSFEWIVLTGFQLSDESISLSQDTLASLTVLENADYRDHAVITITASPANGTIVKKTNADLTRTFTYTPAENFTGTDSFTYSVSDAAGNVSTTTVTFTVFANAAPLAENDTIETYETDPIAVNVLENDSDPDGQTFSIKSVDTPLFGTIEVNPEGSDPGTIVYTANEHFMGIETVKYTLEDEFGRTTTGILKIHVNKRPEPELIGLGLVEDLGLLNRQTENATLTGEVISTRENEFIKIEFDYNGDYLADQTTSLYTPHDNYFRYDVGLDLPHGNISLLVRAVEIDSNGDIINSGDWNYFTFEYVETIAIVETPEEIDPDADLVTDFAAEIVTTELVRLTGVAANTNGGDSPLIEFDLNQDMVADTNTTLTAGSFSQDYTTEIGYGEITLLARTKDWDEISQEYIYSDWTSLTITRDAPANDPPIVSQLNLQEDTDVDGDGITANSTISGTITNSDGSVNNLIVEYDLDSDLSSDGFIYTDSSGSGEFTISFLPEIIQEGENTISVRAREWDDNIKHYVYSEWATISFTFEPVEEVPLGLSELQLVNDTDTPDDLITTDPRISAIVSGDLTGLTDQTVLFDVDFDGIADGGIDTIDPITGEVIIDLSEYVSSSGQYTVYLKVWGWDVDNLTADSSPWTGFTFTYEAPDLGLPEISDLQLLNDTNLPDDQITSDPTLTGMVSFDVSLLENVIIEYDLDGDGNVDGSVLPSEDESGSFKLDLALYELQAGSHTVSVRAGIWNLSIVGFEYGDWSNCSFSYEPAIETNALPEIVALSLFNDTGTPDDLITSDAVLIGTVTDSDSDLSSIPLEFDINGDGVAEGTTYANITGDGGFLIEVAPYLDGESTYTVQVRAAQWNETTGEYEFGQWSSITFTYETELFEDLEGSEPPLGETEGPFDPEDLEHITFFTDPLAPPISGETESMGDAAVYHSEYGKTGDLVVDSSFLSTIGTVDTNESTPFTDTVTTTDSEGNITEVVTTVLTTLIVSGVETADGEWYRRELFNNSYNIITTYTALDGSGYELEQFGDYTYTIESYGYNGNATYRVSETRSDEYVNEQWTAADPVTIYTTTGIQEFETASSGYQKANEDGLLKSGSTFIATQLPVGSLFDSVDLSAPEVAEVNYLTAALGSLTSSSYTASGTTGDGVTNNPGWSLENSQSTETDTEGESNTTTNFEYSNTVFTPIDVLIDSYTTTTNSTTTTTIDHYSSLTGSKIVTYQTFGSRTEYDDGSVSSSLTQSVTTDIDDTYILDYTKSVNVDDYSVPGESVISTSVVNNSINRTRHYLDNVTTITDTDTSGNVTFSGTVWGTNETSYLASYSIDAHANGSRTEGSTTLSFETITMANSSEDGLITVNMNGSFGIGYSNLVSAKSITDFTTGENFSMNSASSSRVTPEINADSYSMNSENNEYSATTLLTESNSGGVISVNGTVQTQGIGGGINMYDHKVTTNVVTPDSNSYSHSYDYRTGTFSTTTDGDATITDGVIDMTVTNSYRVPIGEGKFGNGGNSHHNSSTTDTSNPEKVISTTSNGVSDNNTSGTFNIDNYISVHTVGETSTTTGHTSYDEAGKSKWFSQSDSSVTVVDTTAGGTTSYYSKETGNNDKGDGQFSSSINSNIDNDSTSVTTHYESSGNGNAGSSVTISVGKLTGSLQNSDGSDFQGTIDQSTVDGIIDNNGAVSGTGFDGGSGVSNFSISTSVETVKSGTFYKYDNGSDDIDGTGTFYDDNSADTTTITTVNASAYSQTTVSPQTGLYKESSRNQKNSSETFELERSSSNVDGSFYADGSSATTTVTRYDVDGKYETTDDTGTDQLVTMNNVNGLSGDRSSISSSNVVSVGFYDDHVNGTEDRYTDGSSLSSTISQGGSVVTITTNSSDYSEVNTVDTSQENLTLTENSYQYSDVTDNVKTINSDYYRTQGIIGNTSWNFDHFTSNGQTSFDNDSTKEARIDENNYEKRINQSNGTGTISEGGHSRSDSFSNGTSSSSSYYHSDPRSNSSSIEIKDRYSAGAETSNELTSSGNSHVHDEYRTQNVSSGSHQSVDSRTPVNGSKSVTVIANSWSSGEDSWNNFEKSFGEKTGSTTSPQDPNASITLDSVFEEHYFENKGGGTFSKSSNSQTTTTTSSGGETSSGTSSNSSSSSFETTITKEDYTEENTTALTTRESIPTKIISEKNNYNYSQVVQNMTTYTTSSTDLAGNTTTVSGTTAQDPNSSENIEIDVGGNVSIVLSGPVAKIKGNSNWSSLDRMRVEVDNGSSFSIDTTEVDGESSFQAFINTAVTTSANGGTQKEGTAFSKSDRDETKTVTTESQTTKLKGQWSTSNTTFLDVVEKRKSVDRERIITSGYAKLDYDTNSEEVWSGTKTVDKTDYHYKWKRIIQKTPPENSFLNERVYWADENANGVEEFHTKSVSNFTEEMSEKETKTKTSLTLNSEGEYESPVQQLYSDDSSTTVSIENGYNKSGVDTDHNWVEWDIRADSIKHTVYNTTREIIGSESKYKKTMHQNGEHEFEETLTVASDKTTTDENISHEWEPSKKSQNSVSKTVVLSTRKNIRTTTGVLNTEGIVVVTSTLRTENESSTIKDLLISTKTQEYSVENDIEMNQNGIMVSGKQILTNSGNSKYHKKSKSSSIQKQRWNSETQTVTGEQITSMEAKIESSYDFTEDETLEVGELDFYHYRTENGNTKNSYESKATQSFTIGPGSSVETGSITGSATVSIDMTFHEDGYSSGSYFYIGMDPDDPENPTGVMVPISAYSSGSQTVKVSLSDSYDPATENLSFVHVPTVAVEEFTYDSDYEFAHLIPFYYEFTFVIAYFDGYFDGIDHVDWIQDQGLTPIALNGFGTYMTFEEVDDLNPSFTSGLMDLLAENWFAILNPEMASILDLFGYNANDIIVQVGVEFENGALFDRARGGIDGFLDKINPLDQFWSIPDLGVGFGNEEAYESGYDAGAVVGIGTSIALSVFGPGLVQCGSLAQRALQGYELANFAGSMGAAAETIANGDTSAGGLMNIAGAVLSIIGLKRAMGGCFVGDTLVVVPEELQFEPELAGLLPDASSKTEWDLSTVIMASIAIPVGLIGFGMIERQKKKQQPFAHLDRIFVEDDFKELWHPRQKAPKNSTSPYFRVARDLHPETGATSIAPGGKFNPRKRSFRKREAMHNSPPETSGSQHPANAAPRPHSRLWGGVSMMGLLCLLGTFLISGSLFWLAAPETEQQALIAPSTTVPLTHKKIQDIQPGQWVKAENPAEEDDLEFGRHVDPTTWKLLTCIAPKLDGTKARVQLLRPDLWLSLHHAAVGETIYISVPECGIDGNAQVLEIANCPPIAVNPGPGFQIVTGTFQHEAAQTLDISVEDELKPIGTTPNHPIWSVDREAFVRADSLSVGEQLQTLNGIARITSITARGPPETVFNLEVQVKHTYFVTDSGVLVHNGGTCHISPNTGRPVNLNGRIRQIKPANGQTRFTPLRDNGNPVAAGMDHVKARHFPGSNNSQSKFTVSVDKLKEVLQSKIVRQAPLKQIGTGRQAMWSRDVDVKQIMGRTRAADGANPTSWIRIFVDEAGNLISTFPIPGT